jgi:hypothetical protein
MLIHTGKGEDEVVEQERRGEENYWGRVQITKLGWKYQHDWMYARKWLSPVYSDKHLPQIPFKGQFFRWRHFAMTTMSLIFLRLLSFKSNSRDVCFISCAYIYSILVKFRFNSVVEESGLGCVLVLPVYFCSIIWRVLEAICNKHRYKVCVGTGPILLTFPSMLNKGILSWDFTHNYSLSLAIWARWHAFQTFKGIVFKVLSSWINM